MCKLTTDAVWNNGQIILKSGCTRSDPSIIVIKGNHSPSSGYGYNYPDFFHVGHQVAEQPALRKLLSSFYEDRRGKQ